MGGGGRKEGKESAWCSTWHRSLSIPVIHFLHVLLFTQPQASHIARVLTAYLITVLTAHT